ncbi:hypothetical protein TPA0905_74470 [Streptomyces olivaceus]|nr:hypothetical protein TPA0905_74470 [Streptomyces olivaceus]
MGGLGGGAPQGWAVQRALGAGEGSGGEEPPGTRPKVGYTTDDAKVRGVPPGRRLRGTVVKSGWLQEGVATV